MVESGDTVMTTRLMSLVLVMAMLAIGSGCAKSDWIQQTLVTVDVTGTWRPATGVTLTLVLEQQGSRVTGTMLVPASSSSTGTAIEGTIAGDVFRFRQVTGTALTGEMTVS